LQEHSNISSDILQAVDMCTSKGWHLVPLSGKIPWIADWPNKASADINTVASWIKQRPSSNLGIVTGAKSRLVVIDVDRHGVDGFESLKELETKLGPLPETVTVLSGGGGEHQYFAYPSDGLPVLSGDLVPGIQIKADNGHQVVIPPSIHPDTGARYEWEVAHHPEDTPLAELPALWLEYIRKSKDISQREQSADSGPIIEGNRNTRLFQMASAMRRQGFAEETIFAAIQLENQARCKPPLPDRELRTIAHSASKYEPVPTMAESQPTKSVSETSETFTDLGNSNRFARMFRNQLRYCYSFGKWLAWDGRRWAINETGQAMALAEKCVRSIYKDAADNDDPDLRKALIEHARRSESLSRRKALLEGAQHKMAVRVEELDSDIWLLNVLNGVVDLRTGKLLAHDPCRLITKIAPVVYDPAADCPRFKTFLTEVFPNGKNIISFVQRLIGYSLTGDTREQQLTVAWGNGSNGKGTSLNLIQEMLGDYAQSTPADTLMAKKYDGGIPNDIARLRGARFVLASETQEGRRLNEPLIKQMTGQDRLAARFLRCEYFEFMPEFKLFLLTNDKPVARGDDAALWRRIMLVPFTVKFEGEQCDKTLPDKLRKELPGILKWAVDGCLSWQKNGLAPPAEVIQATQEYRSENDVLEKWIEERCFKSNSAARRTSILFRDFMKWVEETGEKVLTTQMKFSQNLKKKGIEISKDGVGLSLARGIDIKAECRQPQQNQGFD